ncbi:cytochrome P450 734A1-like [Punica granatum]|uniref:Uncharacterized protein n=2 Tax=Punica granatum TaxID=22663 RepID=A0A218W0D0_PUNGR|nr:cytochrome P450 734A1-like [Punica granatum]OWM65979.1 hypothetical protein CDL15_Pgr015404 [Punica granatum]PKI66722.1 hypothetical protein CRG98_012917 [Punica granatum]
MADHHRHQRHPWLSISAVSLSLVVIIVSVIVVRLWWKPRRTVRHFSRQGIRGPAYRFFIGNAKEIERMMVKASSQPILPPSSPHNILPRVLSFYHHWKKIYGATFLVWFGPTARLTVSDPDLIREVLISKAEFYEKIEPHPLVKELEGDGLLSLKGDKWAQHRRTVAPTFLMENLKLLLPVLSKSVVNMLTKWEEKSKSWEDVIGVEIEVSEWFETLMEDVISRVVFGSSFYEEGKAIFQLQAQQADLAAQAFKKVFIPGYRYLPIKRNVQSWKLYREVKRSLTRLVHRRCREHNVSKSINYDPADKPSRYATENNNSDSNNSDSNDDRCPKDLLGLMIDRGLCSGSMTEQDVMEECKTFFFAGKQTTSNLLTWTTVLLAMHPEWQQLAREEVLTVCGARDCMPSKDDIVRLKRLSMILNESLRLYPPAIAMIRRARCSVNLGGYKIPRGTELLIPILAVHHDQVLWGSDATEFNPARFSTDSAGPRSRPGALIPFGLGVRTCIGQNLVLLQAKLTLALMLQKFSFQLAPSYQHAPTVLMMLYPQFGAPIIFRPT